MNKTTEALAVKALEMIAGERMCINNLLSDKDIAREALAAIREPLAEPVKQEPVGDMASAWFKKCCQLQDELNALKKAQPVKREPLCEDEGCPHRGSPHICIEKSVKQEPVFWYRPIDEDVYEGPVHNDSVCGKMWRDEKPGEWLPLYAAPVQPVKQEPVACACGDIYPADSFGAGFIAAIGRCQNCDAAEPVKQEPVCKTCEALARTVMMDQTGKA